MRPYLDGIAHWLRHDFEVDIAPLPFSIALALEHLRRAEMEASTASEETPESPPAHEGGRDAPVAQQLPITPH